MMVAALWLALPASVLAQQIPPGAQPGANQPRDLTSPLPTLREPIPFRIPPVIERPLGVDGPSVRAQLRAARHPA